MTDEKQEEKQPQAIVINTKDQVRTLIESGKLAEHTTSYSRRKNDTLIFINDGNNQTTNPTLAEYLYRAERKIIADMMPEIVEESLRMINEELTNIKELLK